jgi:hypothetical protein
MAEGDWRRDGIKVPRLNSGSLETDFNKAGVTMNLVRYLKLSPGGRAVGTLVISSLLILAPAVEAQDFHHLRFHLGGGFTQPTGRLGSDLNTGWNVNGGVGLNFNRFLGIDANVLYTGFGISRSALNALQQPDGNSHTWGFTLDPVIHFPISSHFAAYITGGGGYFRRTIEFTQPTVAFVPFYDPWFGILGQVAIPANQVLGRFTKSSGGYDIGAGFEVPIKEGGVKLYSEFRYYSVPTEPTETTFIPVSFGLRW